MTVRILIGDCRETLNGLADASVDSVVCDPPYHLTSIVKRFGAENAAPAKVGKTGAYARASKGFMGQTWDGGDVAFQPETWAEVLRVLKPGGHMVAFSGTRTYHRMVCAIEDAGFEVRDQLAWVYGSGFPKSLDVSRAIDKTRSEDEAPARALAGWLRNAIAASGMTLNYVETRVGLKLNSICHFVQPRKNKVAVPTLELWAKLKAVVGFGDDMDAEVARLNARKGQAGDTWQAAEVVGIKEKAMANWSMDGKTKFADREVKAPNSDAAQQWQGWGTALKPSWEPICLARKQLIGTVAGNVLAHGTGALNIDACRIETDETLSGYHGRPPMQYGGENHRPFHDREEHPKSSQNALGRWPANLCHDGSEEVLAGFPDSEAGQPRDDRGQGGIWSAGNGVPCGPQHGDSGSAARFFYCAKATTDERGEGNNHPTVKPVALMQWLCRLVTPKGGTVLDPFMGSGSTGLAADAEQFNFIGCELSSAYAAIAEQRIREAAGMFADVQVAA